MTRRIVIERVRLRVTGGDRAAAERLGQDVARAVAARVAAGAPARPAASVRLRTTARHPEGIADAVTRSLR